jgi:hypothetical protein
MGQRGLTTIGACQGAVPDRAIGSTPMTLRRIVTMPCVRQADVSQMDRSASAGSIPTALIAGYTPDRTPITVATASPPAPANGGTSGVQC